MENDKFVRYVILLSHIPDRKMSEQLIKSHIAYLKDLNIKGHLEDCGPFKDYGGGMIVLRASSYEEAKSIAESDPFVKQGFETYKLRTWMLSCEENNHLGMG